MASVAQTSVLKQLDDITECPICSELFTDPRSLPCIHAYCMKCIEGYGGNRQPGDKIPCPMCRKEFTVPATGLGGLPKNFFIEKLLHIRQMSSRQSAPSVCEVCDTVCKDDAAKQTATVYCVECQKKYCTDCAKVHRVIQMLHGHRLIELGESEHPWNEISFKTSSSIPTFCDRHKDQTLGAFCGDCKTAICVICYIASHNQHRCSDIGDVVDAFRQQMTTDVGCLANGVDVLREMSISVERQKVQFAKQVAEVEDEIVRKAEELKRRIDRSKLALLYELATQKRDVIKQLDNLNKEIEHQVSLMENLKKYTEELSSKGAASDIARESGVIQERVEELLKYDAVERSRNDLYSVSVRFTATGSKPDTREISIGNVSVQVTAKEKARTISPKLKTVLHKGGNVVGVTSLGSQLFVVRYNAEQTIEVYDTATFQVRRNIPVSGLIHAYGLASCAVNNCLYASNCSKNIVHKIHLPDSVGAKKSLWWPVGLYPTGLFVNGATNVLITCVIDRKIQEYTTGGSLVREVDLRLAGITVPQSAIQLHSGQYAVSHSNCVSLFDASGRVIHSYGHTSLPGSRTRRLNGPKELVQLKNGCILVADSGNHRMLVLNSTLSCARDLELPTTDGWVVNASAVCLDESRGRLFVGEYLRGLTFVFDDVFI